MGGELPLNTFTEPPMRTANFKGKEESYDRSLVFFFLKDMGCPLKISQEKDSPNL
jgi:hypothetical protein